MIYTDKQSASIQDTISVLEGIVQDNEQKIEFLEKRNFDLELEISCLKRCLEEQSCA